MASIDPFMHLATTSTLRALLAVAIAASWCSDAAPPCADASAWRIVFEEQFEGDTLNSSRWTAWHNRTHGTTEKQLYVADAVRVADGALHLTTRHEPGGVVSADGVRYDYSSGWIESAGKAFFTYGRVEVRARLPSPAAGAADQWPSAWPAHWLMPEPSTSTPPNVCWPVGGEIDIMEGYHPRGGEGAEKKYSIYQSYHWAEECNKDLWNSTNGKFPPLNDTATEVDFAAWHTYAVEWEEGSLVWYVDGERVYDRVAGEPSSLFVPKDPFYVILNSALTPWTRAADPGFPVEHVVDSVVWCQRRAQPDGDPSVFV